MPFISMRELLRNPGDAFDRVEKEAEPLVVTRHGRPVAALLPVHDAEVDRYLLAAAPDLLARRREAESARAERRTRPLDAVLRGLGADIPAERPGRARVKAPLDEKEARIAARAARRKRRPAVS